MTWQHTNFLAKQWNIINCKSLCIIEANPVFTKKLVVCLTVQDQAEALQTRIQTAAVTFFPLQ